MTSTLLNSLTSKISLPCKLSRVKKMSVRFTDFDLVITDRTWTSDVWRESRRGLWEEFARDKRRFSHRIERLAVVIEPCLLQTHRDEICCLSEK